MDEKMKAELKDWCDAEGLSGRETLNVIMGVEWALDYLREPESDWPPMSDKFYEAIGWMHAECCAALDNGEDPREMEVTGMVKRCIRDLTRD